ncbi:uncharacterized protein [Macrobrachium rosenbergii]|uniref:uncharacterized protein n=1 Tax=Macrobrachium rosenbergii TaxID=79674 RepID=UPI0034D6B114
MCHPEYDYKGVAMDDPHLVDYIRRELLHPPSPFPYSLKDPEKADFSQFGQSKYAADGILRGMRGGFFVEAGALDGEFISNTLYLEKELGWRGLLVEPDPETYKLLRQKHRNAFTINAALSTTPEATDLTLKVKDEIFGHAYLSKEGVKVKGSFVLDSPGAGDQGRGLFLTRRRIV